MGLEIKRNKKGEYKAKSTISDENQTDGWISKDSMKKKLIEKEIWRFLEKIIEIEMNFPFYYYVNDKICMDKPDILFNEWFLNILKLENTQEQSKQIFNKANEIIKKYNLENYFKPLLNDTNNDK